MKIVIDTMGSDNPEEVVRGSALFLQQNKETSLVLCGEQEYLNKILSEYNGDRSRLEIVDAKEVIIIQKATAVSRRGFVSSHQTVPRPVTSLVGCCPPQLHLHTSHR